MLLIHDSLKDGWCGHQEVILPTLLYHNRMTLQDFGGKGEFTPIDNLEKFYTSSECNIHGKLEKGTFRYRPILAKQWEKRNKLYHPVKMSSLSR